MKKQKVKNHVDAYNYITYTMGFNYTKPIYFDEANKEMYNNKYGNFLNHFNDYGQTDVYRLWMIFEESSVCGGLAQTYSVLAEVFGRPSSPSGQPAHAASLTLQWNNTNNRYEWVIQNNITGWVHTANQYNDRLLGWGNQSWTHWNGGGVYTVLASDAIFDENYEEAMLLNLLADSYGNNSDKKEVYEKVLEIQPINLTAMEGLINCYLNDDTKTSTDYFELAKKVVETYTYYPRVMMEVLALIEEKIDNASELVQLDVLKHNALLNASNATPDVSTNVGMSKQTANEYLNSDQSTELATFSFDGEKAGKIVLDSKYDGSEIRVKFSLDGGTTWIESDEHEILLTEEQISSITAENDIIVGLVGASDDFNHTIDILEGNAITSAKVYANDYENLLLGEVSNLEFSLDGGLTWCDYVLDGEDSINPNGVTGIRIEGNQSVKVRYKAYGQHLRSQEVEYSFTENTDTDDKKYVQLKDINVVGASNHQSGRNPELFIDGKVESGYHTKFNTTTQDKFFTVEFNEPKYITSMDYIFTGGNNGRMKSGEILASLDGETWTTIKTFSDMPRNVEVVTFDMDEIVEAKYIKIVPTETHGNNSGETNRYFAGKELRFYEDTTIVEDTPTILPDDVPVEPDNSVDSDMGVNPDEDQVVDDTPVTLPDDVPVEEDKTDGDENVEEEDKPTESPDDTPDTDTDKPSEDVKPEDKPEGDEPEVDTPEEDIPPVVDKPEIDKPSEDESDKPNEDKPDEDNKPEQPPTDNEGEGDTIQPPTEESTPQPPVVTPPTNNGGGGGTVQPPIEDEVEPPTEDEVQPEAPNGIENLESLDEELQEKVDSIVAETVVQEQGLLLSITGDKEDIQHVEKIEVTKDGVFAIIDGKKLKFRNSLEELKLDLTDARAVRVVDETYKAVPHQAIKEGLKVSSSNLENILITSKVSEPFVDVNDTDWFKADVEEAFNYVITQGTTATTYSPYIDITRAQFTVMIARALELKPTSQNIELKDVKGQWYQNEAQALYEAGIIKGFADGTFGGGNKLTRQQAVAMIGRMLEYTGVDTKVEGDVKFADMDKIGEHAQQAVKFLASNGVLVSGENTKFNPYNNLTRAQMAKMLVRSLKLTDLY